MNGDAVDKLANQAIDNAALAVSPPVKTYRDPIIVNCRRCGDPHPSDEPCRTCQREQQESARLNRNY